MQCGRYINRQSQKNWRILTILLFLIFLYHSNRAQSDQNIYLEDLSEEPLGEVVNDQFKPRPKFIEYNIQSFKDFLIEPESELIGDAQGNVRQNLVREFKMRFPILLQDQLLLIGGLGYRHEQFKFNELSNSEYPLFLKFDDRSLNRSSFNLFMRKKYGDDRFLFMYLNSSLNSDERTFNNFGRQLKLSISAILGKNKTANKQMGYGVSFGYDFGQPAIFPIFLFNNDISPNWGYELTLPKSARLRYSPNAENQLFATLELKGASYHLQNELLEGFDNLEFRRSSVRLSLTYERELYDWLWFGVSGGYRFPINVFISEPRQRRDNALILIDAERTLYFDFNLFIVPPKKLFKSVNP